MSMSHDEAAIRTLVATWLEASKSGNTNAVLDLMTDDVVFTVAGRAPFGKEEFRESSKAMAGLRIDAASDIQEVSIQGDVAWMRNRLSMTITTPGGEVIRRSGYTLSVLRKDERGTWRIARDANCLTKDET